MNINTFIAVATCLLVAAYIFVMRMHPDEPSDMTKYIPITALAYFEHHNLATFTESVSQSSFGRKMQAMDFTAVAEEIGATEETVTSVRHVATAVKSMHNNPLIQEFCDNRCALAVLPSFGDSQSSQEDKKEFLQENLVIIAEPQDSDTVSEILGSTGKGSVGDMATTKVQYGRHHIFRIVRNGQTYSLAALNGLFLMGQNERQVRRCIDSFDGDIPSFSDNPELLALKNSLKDFETLLILPFKNREEYPSALLFDIDVSPGLGFLARELSSSAGVTGFFYGAKRQKSTLSKKIIVHFDPQAISDLQRDQLVTPPIKPSRFFVSSANPMFYLWSNSFNLQGILHYLGSGGREGGSDADMAARLASSVIGKDLKHSAMFGKEITVIAEQGLEKSPFPVPLAMIFIPVDDKDTLKATLQEILHTYDVPVTAEEYDSIEYTYWSQSPQDGLCPLYGFFGEYFFLGNSLTLLQKIIATNSRSLSLLDIDSVKKIDSGVAERNNLVAYSNNVQIINLLEIVLRAFATVAAIEDRGLAQRAQVVINKVILPLLEEAKMFDTSVTRSYFTPESIVIDTITNISQHP